MTLLALAISGRGLVDPDTPAIHADDEGFLRGRAAFETVRVYGGRPFRLTEHIERLGDSAARLGLPSVDRGAFEQLVAEALAATPEPDCFLRLYFTPGREGAGDPVSLAMINSLPVDLEQLRGRGIRLISVPLGLEPAVPGMLGGVKSTSYAVNMAAVDEARRRGADDAVFLAQGGTVLEGPTTNIWWRRGRELFTPGLELGILAGVTRAVLLAAAPALGYQLREGSFELADLAGAEEAFTSSSVREVMPVVALDDVQFRRGPAADELQAALRKAVAL
jgi:4-amino-4-deoxychorismate lyase